MKISLHILIIMSLVLPIALYDVHAADTPKISTILPSASVAVSDDALATDINPAGLGIGRSLNGYYLRTYSGESEADDAFFVSIGSSGLSGEFASTSGGIDFRKYTLAWGGKITNNLYFGPGYSWFSSDNVDYNKLSTWQVGLLYRKRYLSIGAVGRNLKLSGFLLWRQKSRPELFGEKLSNVYDFGVALRPGTNRMTLSMDARYWADAEDWDFSYALEIMPMRSLHLRGQLHDDMSFDLQFRLNIAQIGGGSYNRFDDQGKHRDGVGYLYFSQARHTNRYLRRKIVVETEMKNIAYTLRRIQNDDRVACVIIKLRNANYGFGRIQEIRDAIIECKARGKKVISYMESCGTGNYLLASVCDKILLHPSGELRLIGIRAEAMFLKGMLDKLGVRADLEHIGKYKTASDMLTREGMSVAHKEALDAMLDDLYAQIIRAVAEGRSTNIEDVKSKIDHGPYTAQEAVDAGLVDELVYEDQINDIAIKIIGRKHSVVKANEYHSVKEYEYDWREPLPKIAIIYAEGTMMTGESFVVPFTGEKIMGADTIAEAIETARIDSSIRAIVLRIDTPGGLVLASDIIWRELMRTKDIKPIVVSMGDVAASGGYYIAAPADVIVAEPGSITGSIGVIFGKYSLKGLYDKIGIKKVILTRGRHAAFYTDYGDYPPEEQSIIEKQLQQCYDNFVHKVAQGRNMTDEAVDAIAQGRVWTGRQAKEHGLVDHLGGLDLALKIAKKRADLSETDSVQIVALPKTGWLSNLLNITPLFTFLTGRWSGGQPKSGDFGYTAGLKSGARIAMQFFTNSEIFGQQRILLLMPYRIRMND